MRTATTTLLLAVFFLGFAGCGEKATLPVKAGIGPNPTLPPPHPTLLPTVNIAPARGWPAGATPTAAAGLSVSAYANGLDHPRWLTVLPNGDVLVGDALYVANSDAVMRFAYKTGETRIADAGEKVGAHGLVAQRA